MTNCFKFVALFSQKKRRNPKKWIPVEQCARQGRQRIRQQSGNVMVGDSHEWSTEMSGGEPVRVGVCLVAHTVNERACRGL